MYRPISYVILVANGPRVIIREEGRGRGDKQILKLLWWHNQLFNGYLKDLWMFKKKQQQELWARLDGYSDKDELHSLEVWDILTTDEGYTILMRVTMTVINFRVTSIYMKEMLMALWDMYLVMLMIMTMIVKKIQYK